MDSRSREAYGGPTYGRAAGGGGGSYYDDDDEEEEEAVDYRMEAQRAAAARAAQQAAAARAAQQAAAAAAAERAGRASRGGDYGGSGDFDVESELQAQLRAARDKYGMR